MSNQEAFEILVRITSKILLDREDHKKLEAALKTIGQLVDHGYFKDIRTVQ